MQSAGLKLAGFIGSDNKEAARIQGEATLASLGGDGQVVILEGIAGEQNGRNREGAFRAAAAVVLGGRWLFGGRAAIDGTIAGAVLLTVLLDGFALQVSEDRQPIAVGLVVVAAAMLSRLQR